MNIAPPAMGMDTSTHKLLYHYLDSPNTADYTYDPTANAWTVISSSGAIPIWNSGCTGSCNVASGIATLYDPVSNAIIAWNEGNPGVDTLWQGALSGSATSPMVSITAPANNTFVNGTVSVAATAADDVGMSQVQFRLDGMKLGSPVTGAGPSYGLSWDTTTTTNGSHKLTAIATDTAGNSTTSSPVSVTVNNLGPPMISAVAAGLISSVGATITWTTDQPSTSQVSYGITSMYGFTTTLNPTLVTSHSVHLSGLAASTTYHFQVSSKNSGGALAMSGDFTFSTNTTSFLTFISTAGNDANTSMNCSSTANCRTLAAAVSVTAPGGEVVVVSSGGYGPVTISQPVLIMAIGVDASISTAAAGVSAVTINTTAAVTIRGLSLHGAGLGLDGILVQQVGSLRLFDTLIENFTGDGVHMASSGDLAVDGSQFNDNGNDGILIANASANAYVNNSVFDDNGNAGVETSAGQASVTDSSAHYNGNGFLADGGTLTLSDDFAIFNGTGLASASGGTMSFARCLISNNTTAYNVGTGSTMSSARNSLIAPGQATVGTISTLPALQ